MSAPKPSALEEPLWAPYHHISRQGGKNVRGQFIAAFNVWLRLSPETVEGISAVVSLLHNASLLIDDIEDGATLRRGVPVAHTIFGVPLTLNCGNHMYFVALARIMELVHAPAGEQPAKGDARAAAQAELVAAYTDELQELHVGQGLDILWRETHSTPTLAQYEGMVLQKTGGLFRLALKLMLAMARYETVIRSPQPPIPPGGGPELPPAMSRSDALYRSDELIGIVNQFSLLFQILDDYLNLKSEEYHKNKSFCEDLSEGKFSYCITHSIVEAQRSGDIRLYHALRQRPNTVEMKQFCVSLMEATHTFEHTEARIRSLRDDIAWRLQRLGGNALLTGCLESLIRGLLPPTPTS